MRLLLNLIWLVFGGIWVALGYAVAALVMFILIITIPFGVAAARIALFCLWPLGRTLLGLLVLTTGVGLFGRRPCAAATAIMLAVLSALANFVFIPYYPIWALLVIALDMWVIWALTRPGAIQT